jgi:hypothetical protein
MNFAALAIIQYLYSNRSNFTGVTIDDKKEKPQIGKVYDLTKYGTDLMDQRIG